MKQPQSNGLVKIHGKKSAPERGFNCMKLILFLTEDEVKNGTIGTERTSKLQRVNVRTQDAARYTLAPQRTDRFNYHFFNDKNMKPFPEKLKEALSGCEELLEKLKRLAAAVVELAEETQRTKEIIEALNTPSRHDRRFPPYREKLNPRGHVRPIFWHRIRSNPRRRRKPH